MSAYKELQPEQGWAVAGRLRLPPPPAAQRGLLFRGMSNFSRFLGREEVPDVITVLNINPRLFWAWLFFASRLMPYGRLPAKEREMVILRTGWNCRSRYEWGQHVDMGMSVGLSDDEIQRIAEGPSAWQDAHLRALLLACDEMHTDHCISEASWGVLAQRYSKAMLVELTILIGHYQMIAGFLNSAGLTLEPAIEEKLRAFHQRINV